MSEVRNMKKVGDGFRHKVFKLHRKLDQEKANGVRLEGEKSSLCQELDTTKSQWQKQKTLKEMYINRGKETQRELESLQKYTDPDTLSAAKIAAQVRSSIKQKKKRDLQKDYEELQVAFTICQEKFTAELQVEKDKNKLLQSELQRLSALPQEVNLRYEPDAAALKKKVDDLQQELEKETEQKNVLLTHYKELQDENQSSKKKFAAELQVERERNKHLQENLERITASHDDVIIVRKQRDTLLSELEREIEQRKVLQKEYDELQAALSQDRLTAELQVEKEKSKLLQEELEKITVSHNEISRKYETDVVTVRQQAESLKCQLDKEVKHHAATVAEGWTVINGLKAELEALHQKMAEEIRVQQQKATEKEGLLKRELEDLKTQLDTQLSRNLEIFRELKAEQEEYRPPRKRARREEEREDDQHQLHQLPPNTLSIQPLTAYWENPSVQESISDTPAVKHPEEAADSVEIIPETTERASIWKRTRHLLGLKKPQRWKN